MSVKLLKMDESHHTLSMFDQELEKGSDAQSPTKKFDVYVNLDSTESMSPKERSSTQSDKCYMDKVLD